MTDNNFDTSQTDAIASKAGAAVEASLVDSTESAKMVSESLGSLSQAMTDAQASQNDALKNLLIGLVSRFNVNQSSVTEKLSSNDVSMNERTNDTMNKLDIIIQTLSSNNVVSEDNWGGIVNNLNVKSNETQQNMIKYIGNYIVIPLYEQRLNDISALYHNLLEKQIICKIERYLLLFRTGDFSNLVIEYAIDTHSAISNELYNLKREAFRKYLTTSPGATCFSEMTTEAVSSYKSFRKFVSWAYKTLDGLRKSILLYQSYIQLEYKLEIALVDSEILNNNELLSDYIKEINNEAGLGLLFSTSVSATILPPQIKIQYREYINRYGVTLQFEAEKMALVIRDLVVQGLMPKPQDVAVCSSDDGFLSLSDADSLTDYERDHHHTSVTYYVYTSTNYDPSTNPMNNRYYYPLYLTQTEALNAIDISRNQYDALIDVGGHEYTPNDISDASGITSITFSWLYPNGDPRTVVFWQPNSHSYRAVGTIFFPPTGLEYVHYTENTRIGGFFFDSFTYYVYTSTQYDPSTNPLNGKYYYPLYLSKTEALGAVDISHNQYDSTMDVLGHEYTPNDTEDASGVTSLTFSWLYPNGDPRTVVFWQPNSHSYRAVGTVYFPPKCLDYIHYTETTRLFCNPSVTYYVYTSIYYDPITNELNDKYYYPLYLSKTDALNAIDISHNQYDTSIDVLGHKYTPNDIEDPSGVTSITFSWLYPNGDPITLIFWQPNSHSYRAVGTEYFPPAGLEYIHYTEDTIA